MEHFPEPIPAGCERFASQADLAARIGCVRRNVGLLLAAGALRPATTTARHQYFLTADLDALKANAIAQIELKCSRLTPAERAHLGASLISQALPAGRSGAVRLSTTAIDATAGILRGATVAQSGVFAQGKFVYVDGAGVVSNSPGQNAKKLPLFADGDFLSSLLAAVQDEGGKIRVRSDHDDALAARAGYADNFRMAGDRVTCDLHLFGAYRDRDIVLEAAAKSPELIGLSIDFIPSYAVQKDRVAMRVASISAVDLVDQGAVTPAGLFR